MSGGASGRPRHRIFLVPLRRDVAADAAYAHWTGAHAELITRMPGVVAYRQNRPIREVWHRHRLLCSELWFESEAAERAAFRDAYYTDTVMADEATFVDRSSAWHARVLEDVAPMPGTLRLLAFGAEVTPVDHETLRLDRPFVPGGSTRVLSRRVEDAAALDDRTGDGSAGSVVLICRPWTWTAGSVAGDEVPSPC